MFTKTRFSLWSLLLLATAFASVAPAARAEPELGLQAWTFRKLTLAETIDQAGDLGIRYLQVYPGQTLGGGLEGKLSTDLSPDALAHVLAHAKARKVTIASIGVITPGEADWPKLFAFARAAGIKEIVTEAKAETLPSLAALAKKNKIKISLHNHPEPSIYAKPETALAAIADLDDDIFGLCADTGHWARSGRDPVASLRLAKGRIHSLHFKDIAERGKKSRDVPWGTGTSDAAGQLAELRAQGFDGVAYLEYEHISPKLAEDVAANVAFFRAAMKTRRADLAAGRVTPAGYSADVRAVYADGRGRDSARWPSPQPLFTPDLANADFRPGAWAFNAEGILAPTRAPGAKANGDLWTKETYGDFALSLEFRTQEKSNSGVFIRTSDIVNWLNTSIEVQILQGDGPKPTHVVGSIFDVAAPTRQIPIEPGRWYRYVITARGSIITVILENEEINKVDLDKWTEAGVNPDGTKNKFKTAYKDMPRVGRIGLQDHGQQIEFRNLFVERL